VNILIVASNDVGKRNIAFAKSHIDQIKKIAPRAKITHAYNDTILSRNISKADIIIHSHERKVEWEKAVNLKWVQSGSAGVTDLVKALKNTKVILTNASGVAPIPIAEWVLGVMLVFAKRFNLTLKNQFHERKWMRKYDDVLGFELFGKTIGIVGYGRIGSRIGTVANGIGMNIAAYVHKQNIKDPQVTNFKNLNKLLSSCDFIVNCLPLTPETRGFFDMKKFKLMKPGAYFINIGRGATVVERDLIKALKSKSIKGAAVDVTEIEPLPQTSPLWKLENIIITPHISSWTPRYTDRVVEIFCENLKAYLKNKPMPTLVDKNRGY
jgi:phosphoglycerate dehydrogenase-like enzyme